MSGYLRPIFCTATCDRPASSAMERLDRPSASAALMAAFRRSVHSRTFAAAVAMSDIGEDGGEFGAFVGVCDPEVCAADVDGFGVGVCAVGADGEVPVGAGDGPVGGFVPAGGRVVADGVRSDDGEAGSCGVAHAQMVTMFPGWCQP